MTCPDCGEEFPSDSILHRHRVVEHPESVEAEATERAAQKAVQDEDDRFTPDGFLKANHRRKNAPLLRHPFPDFPTGIVSPLPPWDVEAGDTP
jgi:hypothetical protein